MACSGALTRRSGRKALKDERPDRRRHDRSGLKQRNTIEEKRAIKEGQIPADWKDKPAKLAQKDRDARWTVNDLLQSRARMVEVPAVDLAIPAFGYKNHVSIDRGLRPDPQLDDDARRGARRGAARRRSGPDEHGERRLGGHGLPLGEERRCSLGMGSCRASIARSRRAGQCLSACVSPTRRNPKSAARSSTCLRIRKDRWASSCARSAWRVTKIGQSGLQHTPVRLAEDEIRGRMTEDSRPPQVCPDRNNGTDQLVAHLAQTVAALSISRAKIRLLEASNFRAA